MSGAHFWLTEGRFARIAPDLPTDTRGKPRVDDRRVISAIIPVPGSGCRWTDAPDACGPHKTLYNRFVRWMAQGVFPALFPSLAQAGGPPAALLIDSSAVRAHRSAAAGKGGGEIPGHRAICVPDAAPGSAPWATPPDGRSPSCSPARRALICTAAQALIGQRPPGVLFHGDTGDDANAVRAPSGLRPGGASRPRRDAEHPAQDQSPLEKPLLAHA